MTDHADGPPRLEGLPAGWYRLAWSGDLVPSRVLAVEAFESPFALYRLASGEPKLIDPFCPHMGAHLAFGGCVEEDHLVCPFHGWHWDAAGSNVHIPYSDTLSRRVVQHHPVWEAAGAVWGWVAHDLDPTPFPEGLPAVGEARDRGERNWTLRCSATAVVDALADAPFLSRVLDIDLDGTDVESLGSSCRVTHRSNGEARLTIDLLGPGIAVIALGDHEERVIQTHTERGDGDLEIGVAPIGGGAGHDTWSKALDLAIPILDRAVVVVDLEDLPSERPIGQVRSWNLAALGR